MNLCHSILPAADHTPLPTNPPNLTLGPKLPQGMESVLKSRVFVLKFRQVCNLVCGMSTFTFGLAPYGHNGNNRLRMIEQARA